MAMLVTRRSVRLIGLLLGALIATPACRREALEPAAGTVTHPRVEQWFRDYMKAINAHDVDRVMEFYAPEMAQRRHGKPIERTREELRDIREWEVPMQARFDYEIVAVEGDRLTARLRETNLLYAALEVHRPMASEYRWRDGRIVEMNLKEIRETGRVWSDARAELEAWLAAKPATQTAGVLREGRLVFDREGGRKLVPFLAEYRKATEAARAVNEPVMREYIAALDRHDVDGQYSHYSPEMLQPAEGQSAVAKREKSRNEREFEAGSNARWSFTVVGAGLDSLEATVTEGMDFYDALGVGPRGHRARYRFRDGRIDDIQTWDWSQPGRPYEGARDRFVAWLTKERPAQSSRLLKDGRLVFSRRTAVEMTALAREWFGLQPCRLYHPAFNSSGTQIVFSSDCGGLWGIYVVQADGSLPRRVTPSDMEARMPRWSPDGTRFVFQSNKAGNWDIYTVNVDGSGLTRMTDHREGRQLRRVFTGRVSHSVCLGPRWHERALPDARGRRRSGASHTQQSRGLSLRLGSGWIARSFSRQRAGHGDGWGAGRVLPRAPRWRRRREGRGRSAAGVQPGVFAGWREDRLRRARERSHLGIRHLLGRVGDERGRKRPPQSDRREQGQRLGTVLVARREDHRVPFRPGECL